MFGGYGIYINDLFVAIIAFERLYLKADDLTRTAFEAAGCEPFVYEAKGRQRITMSYYTVPDEAMESQGLMQPWARRSLEAALRARASERSPKPRKPSAPASAKRANPASKGAARRK
jgi:DNA transformation protein